MTTSITHPFVSPKGDGPDATLVRPSAAGGGWNANHVMASDQSGFVLGRQTPGPGPIEEMPISAIFPTGIVVPFAGTVAPAGWLLCYGQAVAQAAYPALYAVILQTYGAGPTVPPSFLLPDLRGVVVAGKSDMGGADRGNLPSGALLGQYMGAWNVAVGFTSTGANRLNFGAINLVSGYANQNLASEVAAAASGSGAASIAHDHSVNGNITVDGTFGITVSGSTTADVRQPTVTLNYIIKT